MISIEAMAWLRRELARYTYRPGWLLSVEWSGLTYDLPTLVVRYPARDSNDPDRILSLVTRSMVPPWVAESRDADAFAAWLADALLDVEQHESREWLRRDSNRVSDPHDSEVLT